MRIRVDKCFNGIRTESAVRNGDYFYAPGRSNTALIRLLLRPVLSVSLKSQEHHNTKWRQNLPKNQSADMMRDLKVKYDDLDFSGSSIPYMTQTLQSELLWQVDNDADYDIRHEEFQIRAVAILKIGVELNRRGGTPLMRKICASLRYPRMAEIIWNGIGDWRF